MGLVSWKERGEVPDSDDEDSFDSQSTPDENERRFDEEAHEDSNLSSDGLDNAQETAAGQSSDEPGEYLEQLAAQQQCESHAETNTASSLRGHLEGLNARLSSSLEAAVEAHRTPLPSTPDSTPRFKIPPALAQLDNYLGQNVPIQSSGEPSMTQRSTSELPTIEEISKSYVRLSSPMSSMLSSPPGFQHARVSATEDKTDQSLDPQKPALMSDIELPAERQALVELQESGRLNRRNFRQRKAIQLHPYIVEQQKYRESLKARGITPMRITNTQNENSQPGPRPHPADQDLDSQHAESQPLDVEMADSSQSGDFHLESSPPFTGNKPHDQDGYESSIHDADVIMDDDDDEFPSIDEIGREHGRPTNSRKRLRVRTYSTKSKGQKPSRIGRQNRQPPFGAGQDIFDFPDSPPTTSSPSSNLKNRRPRVSTPLSATMFSKEPTPSSLGQDEVRVQSAMDMPTPTTSASRPVSAAILLDSDSDSDSDDPFAEQPRTIILSSSDESVEIRKVSKKFRGVLPASHLRLDQQQKVSSTQRRDRGSLSLSPAKKIPRRGVALPKGPRSRSISGMSTPQRVPYFTDEDSEDDDRGDQGESSMDHVKNDVWNLQWDPFDQPDVGSAEEDDRIDLMLPSRKRRPGRSDSPPRKRKRIMSSSAFGKGGNSRQPKITEHISSRKASHSRKQNGPAKHKKRRSVAVSKNVSVQRKTPAAPRLGILDVVDTGIEALKTLPQFLRVAARTVKSRKDLGRRSPSRKFIRLDKRDDTLIAQSVLQNWREGTIRPRELDGQFLAQVQKPQVSRRHSEDQSRLASPTERPGLRYIQPTKPRRLAVMSRAQQTSMSGFVGSRVAVPRQDDRRYVPLESSKPRRQRASASQHFGRPAQLESTVAEYDDRHQDSAFRSSKKALDTLYRNRRRRPAEETNVALHRFLADEDAVLPSVESSPPMEEVDSLAHQPREQTVANLQSRPRPRKRQPNRLDAGATIYRQPSDPLIIDYFLPNQSDEVSEGTKLLGLPKFGTSYTKHFDIFPLQSGVFFHETTFLGSGRLAAAINFPGALDLEIPRPYASLKLGDNNFHWGPWDENVSSEIGVCFDWLLEQLIVGQSSCPDPTTSDVANVVTSIIDYVQGNLSFKSRQHQGEFVFRMSEIMQECSARLEHCASVCQSNARDTIEVLVRCTVLLVQVLKLSQEFPAHAITTRLEQQLSKLGRISVQLLLSVGLEPVQRLYDDLQYLSKRERGIRCDQHTTQAWVILMKVFETARIPRGSFWEVVNTQIVGPEIKSLNDARAMEKIWYSMFSLLPLSEFDNFGVVISGLRHNYGWDNWPLPQKLMQRVFALYTSNPRQSPGFNDYCRTIFSRCHYLMLEWGWWKCSGMIGTVFDFFASQKLSHLRNEEVYKSPRFLEELDGEPSLAIDAEDRCFHILLKIIGLALQHLRHINDMKGIRNLVARLLPNHDRQYPKEQAVHHRELASLRNHHDILSTLFWAAPPQLRPPVTLIQDLVIADRSHKEACLINLKAWTNLARFVLAQTPVSLLMETYQPLQVWQSAHFTELLAQYNEAGSELRKQVDLLPQHTRDGISENQLQATTSANQSTTLSTIKAYCESMDAIYKSLPWPSRNGLTLADVTTPANFGTFVQLFTAHDPPSGRRNAQMNDYGRVFLQRFIMCLSKVDPETKPPSTTVCTDESDSQDFGTIDVDAYDFDAQALQPLHKVVLPSFQKVVQEALYSSERQVLSNAAARMSLSEMIQTWASLMSLFVRKEILEPSDVLLEGPNAIFRECRGFSGSGEQTIVASTYWPLFLGELVKQTKSVFRHVTRRSFNTRDSPPFNMGLEWILAIAKPLECQYYEHVLTAALLGQDFYLLSGLSICGWSIDQVETTAGSSSFNSLCIRLAINNMSKILSNSAIRATTHGDKPLSQVKEEFAHILRKMLGLMESELKRLKGLHASTHQAYVDFVQEIAKQIRSHGRDILPLPDFFVHESADFWPDQSDPGYQLANLKAYNARLAKGESGARWETFHYLYNSFKKALIGGDLDSYTQKVTKAARAWSFFEFMIDYMIPTAIIVGFSTDAARHTVAWALCAAWMPTIGHPQGRYTSYEHYIGGRELETKEKRAEHTFQSAIALLSLIMNGLKEHFQRHSEIDLRSFKGIVSMVCQLGDFLLPEVVDYANSHPEMNDVTIYAFRKFMTDSRNHLQQALPGIEYPEIEEFEPRSTADVSGFVKVIEEDMCQWTVQRSLPVASYQDLRRTGQRVKIPIHGQTKEIDLEDTAKKIPAFKQVIEHAGPFTMLESQDTDLAKRAEVNNGYSPWMVDELGTMRPNPERRFVYQDIARMNVLRDMPPF